MKSVFIIGCLLCCATVATAQQVLKYEGQIAGQHDIELEISSADDVHFTGRYHYRHKEEWLSLKGLVSGETQSSLTLDELDTAGRQTGTFSLQFEGESLNGTHTSSGAGKALGVRLTLRDEEQETINNSTTPDGYYYIAENELRIKTVDDKTIEAAVWISNNSGCTGILLRGQLSASPRGWTGLLPDEYENGKAMVTIRFEGHHAQVLIEPKFTPGATCLTGASPYIRSRKRQDSELD